jgi:tripartite-type tricarboxylate transporter receptor subunit TctC
MMHVLRNLAGLLAIALVGVALVPAAHAQSFPNKPIRIIVPYAPGGAGDTLSRSVGRRMGEILGQPVIVENKPGGAGTIGIAEGAKAPADGYTITFVAVPFVITQFVYTKLPYDGAKDFVPLGLLQTAPLVLVVHPSLNVRTLKEYIDLAKSRPGQITYATSGNGTITHMTGELLKQQTGADIVPIQYRGGGQSITDLIGGHVNSAFLSPVEVNQHIASGKIIGVATSTLKRPPSMPNLPTFAESGVEGYDVTGWFGLLLRTGTPPEVVAKLSDALQRALQTPEVANAIAQTGDLPKGTIAEFGELLAREYPRWSRAVKAANIKAE